jgi:uncharacterized protein DUF3152
MLRAVPVRRFGHVVLVALIVASAALILGSRGLAQLGAAGPPAATPPPVSAGPVPAAAVAPVTATSSSAEVTAAEPTPTGAAASEQAADELAGLLSRDVPQSGSGNLVVVPGSSSAPGDGRLRTVRVEIEEGVPVDPDAFATFAMETLRDPRGWGQDGWTFARTDRDADIHLVLATPETSERLCRPAVTRGKLSCRNGRNVVLTHYRWVNGHPDYADNPTGYRQYLVNHEVGHALGHGHEECPGAGRPAPLMQQQTLGLDGCTQNSWPHPGGGS